MNIYIERDQNNIIRAGIPIWDNWSLTRKYGAGAWGKVFLGRNILTGEEVIIRMEQDQKSWLFMTKLHRRLEPHPTVIPLLDSGTINTSHLILYKFVGPRLNEIKTLYTLRQVTLLASGMIDAVRHLHSKRLLHRTISPSSFHFNSRYIWNPRKLCLARLGAVCIASKASESKAYRINLYSSIFVDRHERPSYRDDLISIGYTLIVCLSGEASLPWYQHRRDKQALAEAKCSTTFASICSFIGLQNYFEYLHCLEQGEFPDYDYCIQLLLNSEST